MKPAFIVYIVLLFICASGFGQESYRGGIVYGPKGAFTTSALAFAQRTIWTDATGDCFVPGKRNNGVPNAMTKAQIDNGGEAQIALVGATANNIFVGDPIVGEFGSGTLNITNGGAVSNDFNSIGGGKAGTNISSGSSILAPLADISWTGATSTTWNTNTNWSTLSVPAAADNAVFNGTFT
jgi:T5SS/PEP-CTERM-associated repeat protein